jgi:NitT/TauT family transport system substrate-binding protein
VTRIVRRIACRIACTAAAAAGAALAFACGPAGDALDRVRIAVLPFVSYAPLFIAADEGLFAAEGLDVELVELRPSESTLALTRGEIDAASNYLTTGVFTSMLRGARLRIVADKGYEDPASCAANALVARRELTGERGTVDLRQLRGRRLDLRAAQLQEYWLEALLGRDGLELTDFEVLQVPQQAKLDALRSGGLDLLPWSEPYLRQVADLGIGVPVARPADVLPGQQWAVLLYGPRLLDERPDLGESLMTAYLRGVERYRSGDPRRNAAIVAAHTGLPAELVERCCRLTIRADGRIDTASVIAFQRWAVAKGYLEDVVPVDGFWEPQFAEAATRLAGGGEGTP